MTSSRFILNWQERFKQLYYLPFPTRTLKYFPPDFSIRDPLESLVHRCRKQGDDCAIILLQPEEYHGMVHTLPQDAIQKINKMVSFALPKLLDDHWTDRDIIGARMFNGSEYGYFIRIRPEDDYLKLHYQALIVKDHLEQEIKNFLEAMGMKGIRFNMGLFVLDAGLRDSRTAIEVAYSYASAIAGKRLPQNFYHTRKQLNELIRNEAITVLAQPILHLREGEVFGWEILTRGPQNSPFFYPAELFEFAHQNDLLHKIEFLVFKKALQEISLREIEEQVFINITSITLSHEIFLDEILDYMELFPSIRPQQIILEITERHAIRDYTQMAAIMGKYRKHGFRFAVDDAGSGYSSLQSISELIPDMIKLDKSLIQNIDQISVKQSLLKALLFFAENINCNVIAEGVEREEEMEILFQHEVEMGQGYYFAEPKPLAFRHERTELDDLITRIKYRLDAGHALV